MKKKNENGLILRDKADAESIATNHKIPWIDTASFFFLSLLLLTSLLGVTVTFLSLAVNVLLLAITALAALAVCYLCFLFPKLRLPIIGIAAVLLIAAIFIGAAVLREGMGIVVNAVLSVAGTALGRIFMPLSVSAAVSEKLAATLFLLLVTAVLTVIAAYIVVSRDRLLPALLLLAFVIACLISARSPYWIWYILFFAALALIFLKQILPGSAGKQRGKLILTVSGLILVFGAALYLIFGVVFSVANYEKPAFANAVQRGIVSGVERVLYGSDTTNNLPEGDFTKAGPLKLSKDKALTVTMSAPQSLYLRGYVGSVYTAAGWEDLDKTALYKEANLFYWLHKDGFYGFSQLATAAEAAGSIADSDVLTVKVTDVGASRKYIYTPYEYFAKKPGNALYRLGDLAPNRADVENSGSYTYKTLTNQVKYSDILARSLAALATGNDETVSSYLSDESYYRAFVYENYLEVPAVDRKLLKNLLGDASATEGSHAGYADAMQKIVDYLLNNVSYSEDVSAPPKGEDFLTYFLTEANGGYSVHYATAAALMFRYYGIPARYVEGYIITPKDVENAGAGMAITLTGKNAHAWVEYYRDGVGWVPFEVTPNYLFTMERPQSEAALISDNYDDSGQSGSVEMTNDNYEANAENHDTPEKTDDKGVSPGLVAAAGGAGLVFLTLSTFLALVIRRAMKLNKRRRALAAKDDRAAVDALFGSSLTLLFAAGLKKQNGSLDDYAESLREQASAGLSLRFQMLSALHRESLFSNHPGSGQRRKLFEAFRQEVVADFKSRSTWWKRWKEKYIRNHY